MVTPAPLSIWDLEVLRALSQLSPHQPLHWKTGLPETDESWVTSASVREHLKSESLLTRQTLKTLVEHGYVKALNYSSLEVYRLTPLGLSALGQEPVETTKVESASWTGIVSPLQIRQVLVIVSEIEDICEGMVDNEVRYQIIGLVRALQILLDLPNPPRQGIVELARDPAFSTIVQIAGCLAAIIAAIKA